MSYIENEDKIILVDEYMSHRHQLVQRFYKDTKIQMITMASVVTYLKTSLIIN